MSSSQSNGSASLPRLPVELHVRILKFLQLPDTNKKICIRNSVCHCQYGRHQEQSEIRNAWKTTISDLNSAVKTCKLLNQAGTELLYNEYPGQDVADIRLFLRTVIDNADLRSYVKSATLVFGSSGSPTRPQYQDFTLLLDTCSQIKTLGLYELQNSWAEVYNWLDSAVAPQLSKIESLTIAVPYLYSWDTIHRHYVLQHLDRLRSLSLQLPPAYAWSIMDGHYRYLCQSLPATTTQLHFLAPFATCGFFGHPQDEQDCKRKLLDFPASVGNHVNLITVEVCYWADKKAEVQGWRMETDEQEWVRFIRD